MLDTILNLTTKEITIMGLGAIVALNLLAMVLFVIWAKLPTSKLKTAIQKIIYELDRAADNMENKQKRSEAIAFVRDALGWKRILIPASILGFMIDAEVAAVRKMQAVTDTPNLHEEKD